MKNILDNIFIRVSAIFMIASDNRVENSKLYLFSKLHRTFLHCDALYCTLLYLVVLYYIIFPILYCKYYNIVHTQPSPSSSQTVSTSDNGNPTYADSLGSDCDNIELTGETDSLDEGLGDISSENETVESPNQGGAIHTHTGQDASQEGKVCPSVSIVSSSPSKTVHTEERERIPSRIGFGGIM